MQIYRVVIFAAACSIGWCQQRENRVEREAEVKKLSISCHVDPDARTVRVELTCKGEKPCEFQYQAGLDAGNNYEVILTSFFGDRLAPSPKPQPSGTLLIAEQESIAPAVINPGRQRIESFPFAALVKIPRAGGSYHVEIGRGLFAVWDNPFKLDPAFVLSCKPVDVVFTPVK